jgi:hypothetical protein
VSPCARRSDSKLSAKLGIHLSGIQRGLGFSETASPHLAVSEKQQDSTPSAVNRQLDGLVERHTDAAKGRGTLPPRVGSTRSDGCAARESPSIHGDERAKRASGSTRGRLGAPRYRKRDNGTIQRDNRDIWDNKKCPTRASKG